MVDKLTLQKCADCATFNYPPREVCKHCLSVELTEKNVSGMGVLKSWTELHHSFEPEFANELPWSIGLVTLDVGPTIITHLLLACDPEHGMPVEVSIETDIAGRNTFHAHGRKETQK